MKRWHAVTAIALTAALGTALSGCAASGTAGPELPTKNQSVWALPLDAYGERAVEPWTVAMALVAQKCIEAKGYPWEVVTDELRVGRGDSWSPAGLHIFNEHLAEKYGYGGSPFADLSVEAEQRAIDADQANRATAAKSRDVTDPCLEEAKRAIGHTGDATERPTWFANQLGIRASQIAQKSKPVVRGIAAWHACMVKTGIAGVTDSPVDMPGDSVPSSGPAIDDVQSAAERRDVPEHERRVAIADARCQESSGYAKALYDAQWDAEAKALRENADQLERNRAAQAKLDEKVEAIIAKHAPSAG